MNSKTKQLQPKIYPLMELSDIDSQKELLEKIYAITPESYRQLFSHFNEIGYADISKYLDDGDRITCIMCLDPGTRRYTLKKMIGSKNPEVDYDKCKYALSFLMTIRSQMSIADIEYDIFKDEEKSDSGKSSDSASKKWQENRSNAYKFWLSLDKNQKKKVLNWYNGKDPENAMYHPHYSFQWA